jgi:hypothetical protein
MKPSHWILPLIVAGTVALLQVAPSYADPITYNLVNYPTEQNGWTLSGTITTDGTLGIIQIESFQAATWTITKGDESYTSVAELEIPNTAIDILATSTDLRLHPTLDTTMLALSSNANFTLIEWTKGFYIGETPEWVEAWESPSSPSAFVQNHYIIASTVPEPSTLALLSASALCLLAYAWRRMRLTA